MNRFWLKLGVTMENFIRWTRCYARSTREACEKCASCRKAARQILVITLLALDGKFTAAAARLAGAAVAGDVDPGGRI